MVTKCCIFNCNGNYNEENKEKVFRLPSEEIERKRRLAAIPRDNTPDSKDTIVCERHWPQNCSTITLFGKLRPSNPPSVFNCVPSSLISVPYQPRKTKKASSAALEEVKDEMSEFDHKDKIANIEDLNLTAYKSSLPCIDMYDLSVFHVNHIINFRSNNFIHDTGIPKYLFRIKEDLSYESFHGVVKCSIASLHANQVFKNARRSQIEGALRFLNCMEVSHKAEIIHQHIRAMNPNVASNQKYCPETILRAFEYFSSSRSFYNRLRQDLELPSVKTLTRLTSITKNTDDQTFFQGIFSTLNGKQKSTALLVDEVYVKPSLQFHGDSLFGRAVNKPALLANNNILTFMTVCLFGGPKFVCKMMPVRQLDAQFFFQETQHLISMLQNAGGIVVVIICDENRINQSFFK